MGQLRLAPAGGPERRPSYPPGPTLPHGTSDRAVEINVSARPNRHRRLPRTVARSGLAGRLPASGRHHALMTAAFTVRATRALRGQSTSHKESLYLHIKKKLVS